MIVTTRRLRRELAAADALHDQHRRYVRVIDECRAVQQEFGMEDDYTRLPEQLRRLLTLLRGEGQERAEHANQGER